MIALKSQRIEKRRRFAASARAKIQKALKLESPPPEPGKN